MYWGTHALHTLRIASNWVQRQLYFSRLESVVNAKAGQGTQEGEEEEDESENDAAVLADADGS